jgi:hypothetical protein
MYSVASKEEIRKERGMCGAAAHPQVHGSFLSIEGGSVADCLVDLTGGVAHKLRLAPASGKQPNITGGDMHKRPCDSTLAGRLAARVVPVL